MHSMSDGGKGSSPRPLSVSHEEYSRRWDFIFAKDLTEEKSYKVWDKVQCNCHRCIKENNLVSSSESLLPLNITMMILCKICGNKRCPKASDHSLDCTGSNDPEQSGSVY